MNRTLNVIRMQLINRQTFIWVPLLVLGGALVLSLLIWAILINSGVTGEYIGGGSQAPLWYFLVVGVQSLTLTFPFSQAMSVTRREFYLGTIITAGLAAAALSVIFVVGGLIEQATQGWGLNGYFFYLGWAWQFGPLGAGLVYFALAMFFFVIGFWAATIYKRFGSLWLTIVLVAVGLVFVGILWLVGQLGAWQRMFEWFGTQGPLGLSLWGLLLTAVLAASSFLTLRRAVP